MPYTVIIADDHALYREGLVGIIDKWPDFEVVGDVGNGIDLTEVCRERHPDLVLLDVRMPLMNGIEAGRVLANEFPDTAVVMISMYLTSEDLYAAISNGARGYLLKDMHSSQLHESLQAVMRGQCVLAPEGISLCFKAIRAQQFSGRLSDPSLSAMKDSLTEHERKLLRLVALGQSNKEISARLYLGESTVKKQLSLLLVKLGLENRTQAAVFALRAGLMD